MPLVSPWAPTGEGAAWDRFIIGGITWPAHVELRGDLWKPKNDHRRGRSTRGGRSVATGWDLADFTVKFTSHDDELDELLSKILDRITARPQQPASGAQNGVAVATPNAATNTAPHAFDVKHPALLSAGITQATFEGADAPAPDAPGGALVWTVKLREYRPPTPAPARTVAPATPSAPAFDSGGAAIEHPPFGANRRMNLPNGNP